MVEVTEKQQKEGIPIWNPEFVVTKDKNIGSNMLRFPVQNTKLLSFKHFKVLTAFDIMLNLDQIDNWGLYQYCNGRNTVKQICEMIMLQLSGIQSSQ